MAPINLPGASRFEYFFTIFDFSLYLLHVLNVFCTVCKVVFTFSNIEGPAAPQTFLRLRGLRPQDPPTPNFSKHEPH